MLCGAKVSLEASLVRMGDPLVYEREGFLVCERDLPVCAEYSIFNVYLRVLYLMVVLGRMRRRGLLRHQWMKSLELKDCGRNKPVDPID